MMQVFEQLPARMLLLAIGVFLFLSGFLLSKRELHTLSSVSSSSRLEHMLGVQGFQADSDEYRALAAELLSIEQCPMCFHPSHLFIFIVDALRYDFFLFNHTMETLCSDTSTARPTRCSSFNRFKRLNSLLVTNQSQSILLRSFADPPTTTSQRLKALLTGTLPTFVELGKNFESPALGEDNFVDQMVTAKKTLAFIGDDTWEKLLPNRFSSSQPLDSFNTKDLTYVDDIIEKNLNEILRNGSLSMWDTYIAHFLGVDHIGHTHSAFHPLMGDSLERMDELAFKVINALPPNSMFFLMGDHGMTDEGEHGGSTYHETMAPLFVFRNSASAVNNNRTLQHALEIDQIDIAPTICQLFGIPIPFSSLGSSIQPLLSSESVWDEACSSTYLARQLSNALQIMRYIKEYYHVTKFDRFISMSASVDFMEQMLIELRAIMKTHSKFLLDTEKLCVSEGEGGFCDSRESCDDLRDSYSSFFQRVKQFTRRQWTSFNIPLMIAGTIVVAIVTSSSVNISFESIASIPDDLSRLILYFGVFFQAISVYSNSFIMEEFHFHLYVTQSYLVSLIISDIVHRKGIFTFRSMLSLISISLLKFSAQFSGHIKDGESLTTRFGWSVSVLVAVLLIVIPLFVLILSTSKFHITSFISSMSLLAFFVSQIFLGFYWRVFPLGNEFDDINERSDDFLINSSIMLSAISIVTFVFSCYFYVAIKSELLFHICLHFYTIYCAVSGPLMVIQVMICLSPLFCAAVEINNCKSEASSWIVYLAGFSSKLLYFLSDHMMAFNSLQLSSGMIGSSTFSFWRAGVYLSINTFGSDVLSILVVMTILTRQYSFHQSKAAMSVSFAYRCLLLLCNCLCVLILRR
jgi:GPI ethanolamine phosphate transferase 3 subunit O